MLADLVLPWDEAAALGAEAFARQVAAGDRGSIRRRVPVGPGPGGSPSPVTVRAVADTRPVERWTPDSEIAPTGNGNRHATNGNGNGHAGNGHAFRSGSGGAAGASPEAPTPSPPTRFGLGRRPEIPYVSPLRDGRIPDAGPLELPGTVPAAAAAVATAPRAVGGGPSSLPAIEPPEPVLTHDDADPDAAASDRDIEPALPEEARVRAASAAASPTLPLDASGSRQVLHVRFGHRPSLELVPAMEALRQVIRERPGETSVIVHVPGPGGSLLPMPLRTSVAYDAELLAEIGRRVGEGVVELRLA